MSVVIIYRFFLANTLTLYYAVMALIFLLVNYLKNPFKKQTLTLVPPPPLSDPKYGVHKYIKANNTTLHYVDSGDTSKPLMLFLHGFPEFWYSWRHQIVHFNKKYRCVAVDMRGYGDSERPEGVSSYKLELLVEDVRDLIHQLGHEKCILVAHDWGGLVACRLRDEHPHVLSALVLLGSSSHEAWVDLIYTDSEQMKMSGYIFLFRMPWIPELSIQMNNLSVFERSMLVEGKNGVTQQDIQCFKYWFGKQTAMTSPINYYRANFRYSTEKKFHDEKIPFLFVHGSNEKYLSRLLLERMKDDYAVIETAILENAGHFMQQEEPEKTNKLIDEFLQKHMEAELQLVSQSMEAARRALAAEIPRERDHTQWDRFRMETGIDIDIDFSKRPKDADPSEVLDRIEKIEKETKERLDHPEEEPTYSSFTSDPPRIFSRGIMDDYELWKQMKDLTLPVDPPRSVDELFKNIAPEN